MRVLEAFAGLLGIERGVRGLLVRPCRLADGAVEWEAVLKPRLKPGILRGHTIVVKPFESRSMSLVCKQRFFWVQILG